MSPTSRTSRPSKLAAVRSHLEATTRTSRLALADAIIICVPTPLTPNREPDLGPLLAAAQTVSDVLQAGQLVVLESTTYPGTTRERLLPILEETGLKAGVDFHLAFSPERVDPGQRDLRAWPTRRRSSAASRPRAPRKAEGLYGLVCEQIVPVSTPEVAEMAKLLENIFRSVNIALVNELGMLAERMNVDIYEVIDAAATKPFGYMRFEPGPGMGGHCLPVDPFYLSWKAREHDFSTEFIELAGKVNQNMPYVCVERAERALNDAGKAVAWLQDRHPRRGLQARRRRHPRVARRSKIIEPPAVARRRGRLPRRVRAGAAEVRPDAASPLDEALDGADVALIVTAHPGIDHMAIAAQLPTVDYRGVTRTTRAAARPPMEMPVLPQRDNELEPTEVAA